MRLFKRDTVPPGQMGYEFTWTHQGFVQVRDLKGRTETYSEQALSRLANSSGISTETKNMAIAALDWMNDHPYRRSAREHKTTPSF